MRPLALLNVRGSRLRRPGQSDVVDLLRSQLRAQQSSIDPSFQLLEYCKAFWHSHCHSAERQDAKGFPKLENFVRATYLPLEWEPWGLIPDKKTMPNWNIFLWTIREGHNNIFYVWQDMIRTDEDRYWEYLWSREGWSVFALACETASLEQLEIILGAKNKQKHLVRPSEGEIVQALVRTCYLGHLALVERLLQENADINAVGVGRKKRTALQAAAGKGHLAVVERLLQEKANVNAAAVGHKGRTALQAAAGKGHLAVVERLIQEEANVNAAAADYEGRTALQAAAERGHLAVVEWLLQEKIDINAASAGSEGRTALQVATEGGHLAVVERLLQEKADIDIADNHYKGRTAL